MIMDKTKERQNEKSYITEEYNKYIYIMNYIYSSFYTRLNDI